MKGSHEIDRDLLERVTFIDGHESVPLGLGIAIPGLTNFASMNEIFHHLLESGEVEVPSDPG